MSAGVMLRHNRHRSFVRPTDKKKKVALAIDLPPGFLAHVITSLTPLNGTSIQTRPVHRASCA
jgi:hypothetical protein